LKESDLANNDRPSGYHLSCRWTVQANSIQLLPPVSKRSFNWSYFLARLLRRLNPRNYL
jgi:hypothetical protein